MADEYLRGVKGTKTVVVELDLWRRFKKKTILEGKTMTDVLMNFIRGYLNENNEEKVE